MDKKKDVEAKRLPNVRKVMPKVPVIGVFATSDPRIDKARRQRCRNIAKMAADAISGSVVLPDKKQVPVVYSTIMVDGEAQADIVARQFHTAGVDVLVCVPDKLAFLQPAAFWLMQQFPTNTPINITCLMGVKDSGTCACMLRCATAEGTRIITLNAATWSEAGAKPKMTRQTAKNLVDWCGAAVASLAVHRYKDKASSRDSMIAENALTHVTPRENGVSLHIVPLDLSPLLDVPSREGYRKRGPKKLSEAGDSCLFHPFGLKDSAMLRDGAFEIAETWNTYGHEGQEESRKDLYKDDCCGLQRLAVPIPIELLNALYREVGEKTGLRKEIATLKQIIKEQHSLVEEKDRQLDMLDQLKRENAKHEERENCCKREVKKNKILSVLSTISIGIACSVLAIDMAGGVSLGSATSWAFMFLGVSIFLISSSYGMKHWNESGRVNAKGHPGIS